MNDFYGFKGLPNKAAEIDYSLARDCFIVTELKPWNQDADSIIKFYDAKTVKDLIKYLIANNFTGYRYKDSVDMIPADTTEILNRHFNYKSAEPIESNEAVNHPNHYGGAENIYEVIKVLEAWLTPEEFIGAMKFNIHKYNARAKLKGSELENYEKAGFYQLALIDFCKRKNIGVK